MDLFIFPEGIIAKRKGPKEKYSFLKEYLYYCSYLILT